MSRYRCCVPKCHESGREYYFDLEHQYVHSYEIGHKKFVIDCIENKCSHQVLHGFPNPEKDPNRFREWVMAVGGDILGLNNHYIYKQRRVCHEHFDIKYCCRYNRISNIAVPAMNMPRPIDIPKFTIVERRPFKTMTNLMYYKCCVVNCDSKRKDVNLYRIPSTEIGLQKWLECINSEHLRSLSKQDLLKQFVCQKHFEKRFLASTKIRSRLRVGAYPTLFKPEEISSGSPNDVHDVLKPRNEDHNYYNKQRPHVDHSYCKVETAEKRSRLEIDVTADTRETRHVPAASHNPPHSTPQEIKGSTSSNLQCMQASSQDCDGNINNCTEILKRETSPCSGDENNQCDWLEHSEETTLETRESFIPITESPLNSSTQYPDENRAEFSGNVTVPVVRKRLLHNVKDLTPTGKLIYKELLKTKRQLEFQRKARKARRAKYTKEKLFEMFTKNMNPLAKKIINMQVNLCNRKTKGRRFTDEEKLLALCLYKQSPECYKMLQRIFILPWKRTLHNAELKLIEEAGKQVEENLNEQNHSEEFN